MFTSGRIEDEHNLATAIAARTDEYAAAIATRPPWADGSRAAGDLSRAQGLLPELPLPEIAPVFGAGNSGGTAGPGIQVLSLEVLCRLASEQEQFAALTRQLLAHETVV